MKRENDRFEKKIFNFNLYHFFNVTTFVYLIYININKNGKIFYLKTMHNLRSIYLDDVR